jgi:hypothetical protein
MKTGLLWFDNDPGRQLDDKVARAVTHYRQKYGHLPTLCYVNPAALNGAERRAGEVEVRAARTVLVHHFWLGVAEEGDPHAEMRRAA